MNRYCFGSLLLLVLALGAGGCEKPLFPSNLPRTQYERYDEMRGRYVPSDNIDPVTGERRPALRERLSPNRD